MGSAREVRWEDVERLFDEAVDMAPDDRRGLLEQTHSGDPALAGEVERLLRALEDSSGLFAESGFAYAAPLVARVVEQGRLEPGQRFGNYEVVRELGHGGMATVYLAQDHRHGRQVALKVLRPELSASFGADRFAREIAFAAQLNHPHILPLHDSGTLDLGLGEPALFYAMPYVDGRSLRDRLREESQLPIPEALRIASQVADALEYAHRHDVVHRDIKPENILLTEDHAIVADFGIARALDRAVTDAVTQAGLALGTPAYMSPEQATAAAHLDGRSDVYSLGCVLYETLAGHPPFAGTTAQVLLARHAADPVPSLRTVRQTVPVGVEQAIERALAKAPADRFATAREFAEALAAPDVVSAPQPALPARAALTPGQRKAALVVLATVLVISIVMGFPGLLRSHEQIAPLDPKRLVVAPFANNTGDAALATLGDVAADRLASGLVETQMVQVVDAGSVQGAKAPATKGSSGARSLAQGLGAGTVVWGSYYRRGDSVEFQAQVTDTRSGKIVAPIRAAAGPAADPTTGIEALRQHAMAAVAWHFDPQIEEVENSGRPSNYEAFREFIAADDAHQPDFNCRFAECGYEHWRRAYALDTTFTLPLLIIAGEGEESGRCDLTDSIAGALRLRHDRLPDHDRASLDAAVAGCHGQRPLQLDAARAAAEAGRTTGDAYYLALWLHRTGFFREAVAILDSVGPARLDGGLDIPYHLLGEHQKELAAAEAANQKHPDNLGLMADEARANVGLGQLPQMEQVLDGMLRVPPSAVMTPAYAFGLVARDLEAHGHSAEARGLYERALAWHRSRTREEQDRHEATYVVLLYGAGHWAEARTVVQHLIASANPSDEGDQDVWFRGAQSYLGSIAAHLGDQREMHRVDRWLAGHRGPYLTGVPTFDRARMAAIRGDRDRAMTLLRLAVDQGYPLFRDGLGLHDDPDFKALWGYPPFEEFRRPKESPGGN